MMSRIVFAVTLAAAALLQATLLPVLIPVGVLPNLVLLLVLAWSALRGAAEGLAWGFGVGLVLDALALDQLGTNGLALLPVVLIAGVGRRRFFRSGLVFPIALAALATVAHGLTLALIRDLSGGSGSGGIAVGEIARLLVLQALLNAVLVPALYLVVGWMDRMAPERV